MVRVPSRTEYDTMPAPSWLAWTGSGCCVVAVGALALARCTSPPYDPAMPSSRPKRVRAVRLRDVGCAALFAAALVTCSLVSSSSDYRWRPLWLLGLTLVMTPIILAITRDRP
jgi:hypothetical protein